MSNPSFYSPKTQSDTTVGEIEKKDVKVVKIKKGKLVEIDPRYQEFTHEESIIFLQTVSTGNKLKMLLIPDMTEIRILGLSLGFLLIFAKIYDFSVFTPSALLFFGIISLSFHSYRWAYGGPGHYNARQRRIKKEIEDGANLVVDLKMSGILFSLILIIISLNFITL